MFRECHPRIIVPLAIPSLLKPMASGRALPGLLVPALAQTVFDAGRRRAISESARYDAAIATYRQTSNPVGHRAEKSRVLAERYSGGQSEAWEACFRQLKTHKLAAS
jgi:hypothetical protein